MIVRTPNSEFPQEACRKGICHFRPEHPLWQKGREGKKVKTIVIIFLANT